MPPRDGRRFFRPSHAGGRCHIRRHTKQECERVRVELRAHARVAELSEAAAKTPAAEWTCWCIPAAASPGGQQLRTPGLMLSSSAWPCRITYNEPLLNELNLFRDRGFDYRAAVLFDPTAYPDRMAFQPFRIDASRCERAPMTLENGDSKVVCPVPPEVQIYCGAAFPRRQDLAFHQCELTPCRCDPGKIFWPQRGKIGVGPKAAACRAGGPFGG